MKPTSTVEIIAVILSHCSETKWATKAELRHALETELRPEFFIRRHEQAGYAYKRSLQALISVQLACIILSMTRANRLERVWLDEQRKAGSRWKVRLTPKGQAYKDAHQSKSSCLV